MRVRHMTGLAAMTAAAALFALGVPALATTGAAHSPRDTSKVVVKLTRTSPAGEPVLATASGQTLYMFSGDYQPFDPTLISFFQLACTALNVSDAGQLCTTVYQPLVLPPGATPAASGGVLPFGLGSIARNGVTQVTYFGHPLYTYTGDTGPGQFNADNRGEFRGLFSMESVFGAPVTHVVVTGTESNQFGTVLSSPNAGGTFRSVVSITAEGRDDTTCYAVCQATFPPVLSAFPVAGPGVNPALLGFVIRHDGSRQVTYNGHPLYYFAYNLQSDAPSGQTGGEFHIDLQDFGFWYLVNQAGSWVPGTMTVGSEADGTSQILSIFTTDHNATLYAFSRDTSTTHCTGECQENWPPVITSSPATVTGSANSSLLGTIQRPDGTFQVTYAGHPLYYDAHAFTGTTGDGTSAFGGTFNVVNVTGAIGA